MDPRILREATRAEHEATEALMPLMGPDVTPEVYVEVLQTLYLLMRGWEEWAWHAADRELRPMLERHRRSQLLCADLAVFQAVPEAADRGVVDWDAVVRGGEGRRAGGLTPASFRASLLGAVYVIEGSTLGGRFLARHVEAVLGLVPGVGDAYFQGHGEATGGMWREVLDQIAAVPEDLSALTIDAARRTFAVFGAALRAACP